MQFFSAFSLVKILWTLCFASHLVLLVVLLGRDRVRRFPFFTGYMVLMSLRLLFEELLVGRLAPIPTQWVLISMADLYVLGGIAVVIEIARRSFPDASAKAWLIAAPLTVAVAGGSLVYWGPWPKLADLAVTSPISLLRLMYFLGQKGDLLVGLLTVILGLLVLAFGRCFKARLRSHASLILIGWTALGATWLGITAYWKILSHSIQPGISREQYQHILTLGNHLFTANRIVLIVVALWWIVTLWFDEPGAPTAQIEAELVPQPSLPAASAEATPDQQ